MHAAALTIAKYWYVIICVACVRNTPPHTCGAEGRGCNSQHMIICHAVHKLFTMSTSAMNMVNRLCIQAVPLMNKIDQSYRLSEPFQ